MTGLNLIFLDGSVSRHTTNCVVPRRESSTGQPVRASFNKGHVTHLIHDFSSRLYSEKAYVLSRGFVRRSLEIPLGSLEAEITWLYRKQGRLEKVIKDARALIEKSQSSDDAAVDRERAVPRLTAGGIITLGRTLGKLEGLQSMPPS